MASPVNAFHAYQTMLQSGKRAKVLDFNNTEIKPYKVKKFIKDKEKAAPVKAQKQEYTLDDEEYQEPFSDEESVEDVSFDDGGGEATKRVFANDIHGRHRKYGKIAIVHGISSQEKLNKCVFSSDENELLAALDNDVPTNKFIQSALIDTGYYTLGITKAPKLDIGMVDALVWQCALGNINNVRAILTNGYKVPQSYPGLSPISAALLSKNIEVLKLVLAYHPICSKFINKEDGFGFTPLENCAKMGGIDPYEFAITLIKHGAKDVKIENVSRKGGKPSALMLCLMNRPYWTSYLFATILGVSSPYYTDASGRNAFDIAKETKNIDALRLLRNFDLGNLTSTDSVLRAD